jgi:hypothetical protein
MGNSVTKIMYNLCRMEPEKFNRHSSQFFQYYNLIKAFDGVFLVNKNLEGKR